MDSKIFMFGLALGMIGGALIVANSQKARNLVTSGQQEIMRKAEEVSKNCKCDCKESKE